MGHFLSKTNEADKIDNSRRVTNINLTINCFNGRATEKKGNQVKGEKNQKKKSD